MRSTVLVTGVNGQVGWELLRTLQGLGTIVAADRARMDLSDPDSIRRVIRDIKPTLIVNPAAYTAVDKAEQERELAMQINGKAPGIIGEEAQRIGAAVVHYSTDYVFDGTQSEAYKEDAPTNPINYYGLSKLAGEQALSESGVPHIIFRTSWVYGTRGKNFLLTMLRLAKERDELKIVSDQFGAPTWCRTIAEITAHVLSKISLPTGLDLDWFEQEGGVINLCAEGETTWSQFACEIFSLAKLSSPPLIHPIKAVEFPLPAKRPQFSRLDLTKLRRTVPWVPGWSEALALALSDLPVAAQ